MSRIRWLHFDVQMLSVRVHFFVCTRCIWGIDGGPHLSIPTSWFVCIWVNCGVQTVFVRTDVFGVICVPRSPSKSTYRQNPSVCTSSNPGVSSGEHMESCKVFEIIGILWWLWRFPQCLERDWTWSCWSKLLQFSRSEGRRVCVFVRDLLDGYVSALTLLFEHCYNSIHSVTKNIQRVHSWMQQPNSLQLSTIISVSLVCFCSDCSCYIFSF